MFKRVKWFHRPCWRFLSPFLMSLFHVFLNTSQGKLKFKCPLYCFHNMSEMFYFLTQFLFLLGKQSYSKRALHQLWKLGRRHYRETCKTCKMHLHTKHSNLRNTSDLNPVWTWLKCKGGGGLLNLLFLVAFPFRFTVSSLTTDQSSEQLYESQLDRLIPISVLWEGSKPHGCVSM